MSNLRQHSFGVSSVEHLTILLSRPSPDSLRDETLYGLVSLYFIVRLLVLGYTLQWGLHWDLFGVSIHIDRHTDRREFPSYVV